jgi:hypothetical protein
MSLKEQTEAPAIRQRRIWPVGPRRYLTGILGGAVAALVVFCAAYGVLYVSGYLPPPPLSNNVCTDEKLVFFRQNPPAEPNLLVFGSSVAWRNIDSSVIARELPGRRPLNAGFCGMQINQSAFIADWMLHHWPSVDQLILVASPLDYTECRGTGAVFDPADADSFVFDRAAAWVFYLRYFDPVSLNRNIRRQAEDREQARILKVDRSYTPYGDGPLKTKENRGLFYGPIPAPDSTCFAALRKMAAKLAGQGRRLLVVATPIHPDWKSQYDPDGRIGDGFARQLRAALAGTGARLWNADAAGILDATAFTDAIHIRWEAAQILTSAIVAQMRSDGS